MNATKKPAKPAVSVTVDMAAGETTSPIQHSMLTIEFGNGQTIKIDTRALPPNILSQAIAHGLKQKLVDAAAISRDPATGRAASIDTKFHAVDEVATRLLAGDWNKRREGGGAAGGLLFRALCAMYAGRKTPEQVKEFLDAKSDKEKAALRKNARVAKIIDELRAEEGGGSADDLLAELEQDAEVGADEDGLEPETETDEIEEA
jgi:hypothetical protein